MFIKIIAALLTAVFLSTVVVGQTTATARGRTETIRGIVQFEVVEATETRASYVRFFVAQCNGAPCDFEALRANEANNFFLSEVNIQKVYLSGKDIDFESLSDSGSEIILRGKSSVISRKAILDSSSSTFEVSSVEKVVKKDQKEFVGPTASQLFMPPFTLPSRPTSGQMPFLFVRLRHQAVATSAYNQDQIKEWTSTGSNSANRFFTNQSANGQGFSIKGLNDITGDVTPEITITATATTADCAQHIGNDWVADADNQLQAMGYSKVAYPVRVYLYAPMPGCTSTASASGRSLGDTTTISQVVMQLPASGTLAALNAKLQTLIHEIEHALGQAAHASGQQCETCVVIDNRDNGDPTGSLSTILNNNIYWLKFMWGNSRFRFALMQNQGTQTLGLQPPSITLDGTRARRAPMGIYIPLRDMSGNLTGETMVLEAARPEINIWDKFTSDTQAYAKGLAIRIIPNDISSSFTGSRIQDATPATACCKDAPLVPDVAFGSATYISNLYGLNITAHTPIGRNIMIVDVTLGTNYPVASGQLSFSESVLMRK